MTGTSTLTEEVSITIVSGNSIEAARQCIFLAAGANGSDVRITHNNVFSGAGAPVGNAGYVQRLMTPEGLAKGATVSWADSVPTAGDWVRGSLVYKTDVSSSDYVGWVCVTGGTPGVWEPFGRIGEERLVFRSTLGSRYAVTVTNTGTLQTALL